MRDIKKEMVMEREHAKQKLNLTEEEKEYYLQYGVKPPETVEEDRILKRGNFDHNVDTETIYTTVDRAANDQVKHYLRQHAKKGEDTNALGFVLIAVGCLMGFLIAKGGSGSIPHSLEAGVIFGLVMVGIGLMAIFGGRWLEN